MSLSAGHNLVCDDQVTISLAAGSYLYQNSNTQITNCIIASTTTPIKGEIQSANADHVELHGVTFVGGGNSVYWESVTDFVIADTKIVNITCKRPGDERDDVGSFPDEMRPGAGKQSELRQFCFPGEHRQRRILRMDLSS